MLCMKPSCFSLSDMDLNGNYTDVLGDIESLDPSEQLQALRKDYKRLAEEHKRMLAEWYKDCEGLYMKVVDLEAKLYDEDTRRATITGLMITIKTFWSRRKSPFQRQVIKQSIKALRKIWKIEG